MAASPAGPSTVGIIVLGWNHSEETLACLDSLSKIVYRDLQILYVDNGSDPDERQKIKKAFSHVEWLELPVNRGFAGGMNSGIAWCLEKNIPYVLILNNDTCVDPNFLAPLVAALEKDPSVAGANPKILVRDHPEMIWFSGGVIRPLTGRTAHRGKDQPEDTFKNQKAIMDYATGCCLLLRAGALRRVGLLDESYFAQCEDVDLSLRLRRGGFSLLYVPQSVIWHGVSASMGGEASPMSLYFRVRNHPRLVWKQRLGVVPFLYHAVVAPAGLLLRALLKGQGKAAQAVGVGYRDFLLGRGGEGAMKTFVRR